MTTETQTNPAQAAQDALKQALDQAMQGILGGGQDFQKEMEDQRKQFADARNNLFGKLSGFGEKKENAEGVDELVEMLNGNPLLVAPVTMYAKALAAKIGIVVNEVLQEQAQNLAQLQQEVQQASDSNQTPSEE